MQPLHIQVNLPSSSSSTAFPLPLKSWSSEDSYEVVNYNEVQFPDFRHIKRLGRGSYGTVVQCFFRGRAAAAKLVENGDEHSQIRTEAELLQGFRHKNIIKLYALFHGEMSGLVLELMEGGSLHELLHQHLHITYQACHVLNWALQVGEAISYLHAHNFIHRDIKPSNMLLSRDYKILKLCDFGTVAELRTSMTDNRGTAAWMAPEVFRGKKYGQKCDIFSLGISLWEIITRRQPFTELNENPLTLLWKVAENGLRPPRIQDLPEPLMDLIERCWENNPDERPCLEEVQKTLEAFLEIFPNANLLPLVDRTTHRQAIAESPQKQPGQHFWPSQQHQTTPPSGQQQQTPPPHFPPPTISVPVQHHQQQHHQQSPDHSLQPFFPQIPSSPQPHNQLHPTHHNQHIIVQTHRRRNSHDSRFLQLPTHPFQQMESSSPHSSHSLIDIPGLSNQHTQHSYYYRPAVNNNNNGGGGPYNPCLSPPMHPPPDIYGPPSQPNVSQLHRSITLPPSHVMDHQNESEWQQNGDASPKHPGKKHKKRGFFGFRFRL